MYRAYRPPPPSSQSSPHTTPATTTHHTRNNQTRLPNNHPRLTSALIPLTRTHAQGMPTTTTFPPEWVPCADPGDWEPDAVYERYCQFRPARDPGDGAPPVGDFVDACRGVGGSVRNRTCSEGAKAWTSFGTTSRVFISPVPPLPRRTACSTPWLCVWNADWGLRSDVMTNSRLQASVQSTATSTSFWTISHGYLEPCPTPYAPCDGLCLVAMLIGCVPVLAIRCCTDQSTCFRCTFPALWRDAPSTRAELDAVQAQQAAKCTCIVTLRASTTALSGPISPAGLTALRWLCLGVHRCKCCHPKIEGKRSKLSSPVRLLSFCA